MPDIWMDVDAAVAEVPVNVLPLIDDTDFKSREVAITYDQAGMDLVWNFVTTAGAMTQTAVSPTTGGDYDWAHQGDGMYSIEIPASGGGSINNDTEGFGWFTGYATGVLPWRGPTIGFRAAALNNLLIDAAYSATRGLAGTALPDAAADAAGGLPISDAGELDLDTKLANTNEVTAARLSELDAGTAGKMANQVDEIRTDTGEIGTAGAGLTDLGGMSTGMKAEVESEANDALVAVNLDHLAKEPTAGADMTAEVVDNTILSRMLANGDTSAFVPSTDGLQPIRDTAPLGTAMRGTDSAALASVCTEARLAELAAANLPTDIAAIPTAVENRDALTGGAYALDTDANGRLRIVDGTGAGELDTDSGTVLLRSATETQIDNIEGDTNELQIDWANAGRLDALIDLILGDTGELQADWANGGRLDLLIDLILGDTAELQGLISASKIAAQVQGMDANVITDAALAADVDTYQAKAWVFIDEANTNDRYTATFYKNGQVVTSGITSPIIQVIKMADDSDLIAETALTQVGSTHRYRHNEETNRITAGVAYTLRVGATIGGSARIWDQPIGRDSTA